MVLKEFLSDLQIAQKFFTGADFRTLFTESAEFAVNAKDGSDPNWQPRLNELLDKIDEIVLTFELENKTLLIENQYLNLSDYGYLLVDYRSVLKNTFADILSADTRINELSKNLEELQTNTQDAYDSFENVGIDMDSREDEGYIDLHRIDLKFKSDSDFSTLRELGTTGRNLNVHMRSLSMLDFDTPTGDIEINIISKSSPFDISLWVSKKAADAINIIAKAALESFKKYKEIQLVSEQVKQAKIDTAGKEIKHALLKARAELEHRIYDEVTQTLMSDYPTEGSNGTKPEVEAHVKKAVEYFIDLSEEGLEIKVLPPARDLQANTDGKQVIQDYQRHRIESKNILKELPEIIKKPEEDDSAEEENIPNNPDTNSENVEESED